MDRGDDIDGRAADGVRRRMLIGGTVAAAAGTVLSGTVAGGAAAKSGDEVARPAKLSPGDVVVLVSPGGPTNAESVEVGVALLSGWGLDVRVAEHALDSYGYLSAPDADRLADLTAALGDPEVRAIMATRGGYGTQRIVDGLDLSGMGEDAKLIIGYSDITTLHLAAYEQAGVSSLHAPMAAWASNNTDATAEALRRAVMTADPVVLDRDPGEPTSVVEVPGTASGTLLGGNLTLLASEPESLNSPDLAGAILFIEDVGEAPYRIDRMLTQLLRAGRLSGVAGVAVGQFVDCVGPEGTWTVEELLAERLEPLGVPVLGGLKIGHGADPRVMPLGVPAELDTDAGTLTVEAAVS